MVFSQLRSQKSHLKPQIALYAKKKKNLVRFLWFSRTFGCNSYSSSKNSVKPDSFRFRCLWKKKLERAVLFQELQKILSHL